MVQGDIMLHNSHKITLRSSKLTSIKEESGDLSSDMEFNLPSLWFPSQLPSILIPTISAPTFVLENLFLWAWFKALQMHATAIQDLNGSLLKLPVLFNAPA